uniref:Fungal lipase-type domain-containing protein n=1 Tax=Hanusia phi TaxID=3032 RepID=A0A7S0EQZ3_9CRYP|mmetsp:Transcript_29958/g.67772  ORF Transcript_29958/g.67772 Transcript_29958/m.67772 type:complete len:239 (+) Transcript_29958:371-1087(+)
MAGSCFALSCNFSTDAMSRYSSARKSKHEEASDFSLNNFFQVEPTEQDDPTWKLIHWYARFANLCGSKRNERVSEVQELFEEEARSNRADENQAVRNSLDVDVSVVRAPETKGLAVVSVSGGRDRAVIAVRGSVCAKNFVQACKVWPRKEPLIQHVSFHTGFAEVADELMVDILPRLDKNMRISLTGHSLGGAVSTILGMRLKSMGYNVNEIVIFGSHDIRMGRFSRCGELFSFSLKD